MTRVLHTHLHRARLRDLVATHLAGDDGPPHPVMAVCPTCGTSYFADLTPMEDPWELELEEWEALAKRDGECPDHPHWFLVGR